MTCWFYSTPQVVEVLERNSGNKGTKDQSLHTFLQYKTHFIKLNSNSFNKKQRNQLLVKLDSKSRASTIIERKKEDGYGSGNGWLRE